MREGNWRCGGLGLGLWCGFGVGEGSVDGAEAGARRGLVEDAEGGASMRESHARGLPAVVNVGGGKEWYCARGPGGGGCGLGSMRGPKDMLGRLAVEEGCFRR